MKEIYKITILLFILLSNISYSQVENDDEDEYNYFVKVYSLIDLPDKTTVTVNGLDIRSLGFKLGNYSRIIPLKSGSFTIKADNPKCESLNKSVKINKGKTLHVFLKLKFTYDDSGEIIKREIVFNQILTPDDKSGRVKFYPMFKSRDSVQLSMNKTIFTLSKAGNKVFRLPEQEDIEKNVVIRYKKKPLVDFIYRGSGEYAVVIYEDKDKNLKALRFKNKKSRVLK